MSTSPVSSPSATASRPSIVQLVIKEKSELYAAYIPLFKNGGLFIATAREHKIGDNVYVLLTLPEETQRHPVTGKVAWITPAQATGNRTQGIGLQFPSDEKSQILKAKIEEILGPELSSAKMTHTV